MGHDYKAIGWNRQKRVYDLTLLGGVVLYLVTFITIGILVHPNATIETLIIRGLATAAFLLLHVVLAIGPLCRLSPRFLPLLYNRRHMGVTTFLLALGHAVFSIVQFHTLGDTNPIVSVLIGNTQIASLASFPFQPLGLLALIILFIMAATSHDFWMANLTPPVWKSLHMLVYFAYALLVMHVTLGVLQAETSPVLAVLMGTGIVAVSGLHVVAAVREKRIDTELPDHGVDGFIDACSIDEIEENRAQIVTIAGDRVAVFKYDGKVSAVSNVCQHQNGPLGEGCIIDGYITCPWHGYQYVPETGVSPPPFTERIPTFDVRLQNGRVLVAAQPNPPGTRVEPARIAMSHDERRNT